MTTDAASVIAAVLNGDYDEDLGDIADAMLQRETVGAVESLWRIDFDGLVITAENVSVNEAIQIEETCRQGIRFLKPDLTAMAAGAVVLAVLQHRNAMPLDAAKAELQKASALKLLSSVSYYTVPHPPKDGSPPATSEPSPPST